METRFYRTRLQNRINSLKGRIHKPVFQRAPRVKKPNKVQGQVVITALGSKGFSGPGKLRPWAYLPSFCKVLAQHGLETIFIRDIEELDSVVNSETHIINIYGEDQIRIDTPFVLDIQTRAKTVFNNAALGITLTRKDKLNRLFLENNIPAPSMEAEGPIFSNQLYGTGATIRVIEAGGEVDAERYNTEFIDTRREFFDEIYYTTIRLMCVGTELIHAYPRARNVKENSPSVHNRNTPRNPKLLEFLYEEMISNRIRELQELSYNIGKVLGPGFYAHDVLVDRSGNLFVCESGFKFEDMSYIIHLLPIAEKLPSQSAMYGSEFPERSAAAYLRQIGVR